jgi:hypothetical protein
MALRAALLRTCRAEGLMQGGVQRLGALGNFAASKGVGRYVGSASRDGCSRLGMSVTSTLTPGACSAVPAQTTISPCNLPSSFNTISSIPNTEGGPSQTRLVLTVAVSRSPFCS